MQESEHDLTGEWRGIYNYPSDFPPNSFEASLVDAGGRISGVIRQPGEFFEPPGIVQHAVIDGAREGAILTFVKIYDDLGRVTPHYRGTIQPGGDEVVGEWTIPGDWSGTFLMVRAPRSEAAAKLEVGETVDAR